MTMPLYQCDNCGNCQQLKNGQHSFKCTYCNSTKGHKIRESMW
jgi:DNA-directed RNA polymerase subunit RPC12/RpoP